MQILGMSNKIESYISQRELQDPEARIPTSLTRTK